MTPRHSYSDEYEISIIHLIEKFPGLGLRELAREMSTSPQSLKYYTDQLLKEKKILIKKDGKFSRFYEKNFKIEEFEEKILRCFRKPHLLNVIVVFLDAYKRDKTEILKNQELISKLQVQSAGTITYYLNQLMECGLVEKSKEGFKLKNKILLERLLKKYKPTPSIIDTFIELWTNYFK